MEGFEELKRYLSETVHRWRIGDDCRGLHCFIESFKLLEKLARQDPPVPSSLYDLLKNINKKIQNEDVTGITDLLEFRLIPLVKQWEEEVNSRAAL